MVNTLGIRIHHGTTGTAAKNGPNGMVSRSHDETVEIEHRPRPRRNVKKILWFLGIFCFIDWILRSISHRHDNDSSLRSLNLLFSSSITSRVPVWTSMQKNNNTAMSAKSMTVDNNVYNADGTKGMVLSKRKSQDIRNLRLVLIGDSLTRYQYISLVNYLEYGRWITIDDDPNPVLRRSYQPEGKWSQYFYQTNNDLHGREVCDCYRDQLQKWYDRCYENRYYWNPEQNTSVVFINKNGKYPVRGHFRTIPIPYNDTNNGTNVVEQTGTYTTKRKTTIEDYETFNVTSLSSWSDYNWTSLIDNHLGTLNEPFRPKHVVFNAGHIGHDLHDVRVLQGIRLAFQRHNFVGIYKTTTADRGSSWLTYKPKAYELTACGQQGDISGDNRSMDFAFRCMNTSWTVGLNDTQYFDKKHFTPEAYQTMNEQMLQMIL